MKKTIIALLMLLVFPMMNLSFAANNAVPRSSYYIDSCTIMFAADGDGEMTADFTIEATDTMIKLGVSSLVLEEEQGANSWKRIKTIYGSSNPKLFYSSNAYDYSGLYTFTGLTPGVRYRVKMTAYAEDRNGSDTSTATSFARTCK